MNTSAPAANTAPAANRRLGILLVLISTLAWSFSGLFARLVSVDLWTATWFRAIVAAIFLACILLVQQRGRAPAALLHAVRAAPISIGLGGLSMVLLMAAFFTTSVANVVVIYATAPFWAALMTWLLYGTPISGRTMIAAAVALAGVATVVGGSIITNPGWGDLLAFGMTITFIGSAVLLGHSPDANSGAVTVWACILCIALIGPFATAAALTPMDMLWLGLFGICSSGLAYICFMAGTRLIPATEAGLIGVLEVPLAPLWMLLVLGEVPANTTLLGGALIVAAIVWHLVTQRNQVSAEVGTVKP